MFELMGTISWVGINIMLCAGFFMIMMDKLNEFSENKEYQSQIDAITSHINDKVINDFMKGSDMFAETPLVVFVEESTYHEIQVFYKPVENKIILYPYKGRSAFPDGYEVESLRSKFSRYNVKTLKHGNIDEEIKISFDQIPSINEVTNINIKI